jgi:ComF family protein
MHPILKRCLTNLTEFIYPPFCLLCDNRLSSDDPWLCGECRADLQKNRDERDPCLRCGQNRRVLACTCDIAWDHPFESIHALFDFQGRIRDSVHQIKYRGKSRFARCLTRRWTGAEAQKLLRAAEVIAPVPLHRWRRWKRGYNQAHHLAAGMADAAGRMDLLVPNLLIRKRSTRTQTKLDRDQRWENLAGAFAVNPKHQQECAGRRVVLVDDVVTTGATTAVCTEALLAAGAESARVVCLARD